MPEPIAIVGIGCRLPGGIDSPERFWEFLRDGREAIGEVPPERWDLDLHYNPDPAHPLTQHVRQGGFVHDIDRFDAAFFGITPREAVCMDPQQRLLLEVAWRTLEDAGLPLEQVRGTGVGVFMGISSADYSSLLWASRERYTTPDNEPFVLPGNTGCIAANRLSYFFDFKGPSFTVDTACSSSLVAVHLACESIWRGESEAALAGGVQALIHPGIQMSFCKAGLLASDGRCKSFDASADGYVRSEGAGAVLLKPLAAAQAAGDPIYAVIHGSAVNSDGRSNGMVAPNARAQIACVRAAFARAGIDPAATQYVEAHGTGTRQGDPIELRALGTVLGEGRPEGETCRVGSIKTNLGHSETAAGITGLIKAALCVAKRQLPPSLHCRRPNPSIDFAGLKLQVQTSLEPFPYPERATVVGVSSFGFGGTNAHVVLADAPQQRPPMRFGARMPLQLLSLSARTPEALAQVARDLAGQLQAQPTLKLADLAASANLGRTGFRQRAVCLARDNAQLLAQLQALAADQRPLPEGLARATASRRPGKLAWLFTGQGSQALAMGQELLEHPSFREAFERVAALLDPQLDQPLRDLLKPRSGDEAQAAARLNQTGATQPALFALGYALSQLWRSWGVRPDLLMGHSIGEVLAAHLAGVFSLEDACRLVAARGRLMQALPAAGGMAALLAPHDRVRALLARHCEVSVAAYNGPLNTVVAGPTAALRRLLADAETTGLQARQLAVSHAFHTQAMAPMLEAFERELRQLSFSPPNRSLVSTLTGQLAGAEMAQPDYWCDQVLSPVRFAEGVDTLVSQGAQVFLEIGARPTLIGMARQCSDDPALSYWPSLVPGQSDWDAIFTSLGGLWRSGFTVDWQGFHRPFPYRRVTLPGYPFEKQRYWWSRQGEAAAPASFWLDHLGITAPLASPVTSSASASPAPTPTSPQSEPMVRLDLPGDGAVYQALLRTLGSDLGDHRIRGQAVFPAAGFITAALGLLKQAGEPLALGPLQLDQPLKLVGEPADQRLQCHWRASSISFHSRPDSPAVAPWLGHGEVAVGGASAADAPLDVAPSPATATPVDLAGLYDSLAAAGLAYGPSYRGLSQLQVAEDQAWAVLERPVGGLDRGLIDSCFQAVAVLLDPAVRQGQLLLPVGLDALWLAALPLPDRLHCQVRLQPSEEPAFVRADLLLHDGAAPLGWIRGFRLRRLPRQALEWLFPLPAEDLEAGPQDWLLASHWQEAPPLEAPLLELSPDAGPEPLLLWPDLGQDGVSLEALAAELLLQAQQLAAAAARPVWLVLEGGGALASGLAGFARSAALEQPALGWTVLHLADGDPPAPADWPALLALGEREPLLAWRDGRAWVQRLQPLADRPFRLESGSLGSLETLRPLPLRRQPPGAGELELAVEATGLNFRDVLNALGLLAGYSRQLGMDAGARMPYGGECVGRVVAVGAGVDPALVGQRLLAALAVGSLASHVVCRAALCVPLPATLDPALGASVSTAFLTAIYGLQNLAQLRPGETVLIHAAAGGVGQAALQVALRCGARVLATASAAKQAGLLAQGVEAVFDSRSLDFRDQVLDATGGRGVDVVLNSLKGDWVDASFDALAEGGRFVELGKIEIWSRQEAVQRRPDARYLPFDLLEVAAADPALVRGLLLDLLADLEAGHYAPIPLQTFPIERSVEAFRLMAQARHVGKVVISQGERPAPWLIGPEATYLVTGAFGGIGQQLCRWLAARGARSLVLVGRRPDSQLVEQLRSQGVTCVAVAFDLAADSPEQLAEVLRGQPLAGLFHAAGQLDDGLLEGQSPARQAAVIGPKWGGWQRLEQACQLAGCRPAFGVAFSSMAALLGSPGQTSYAIANGALDGLAAAGPQASHQAGFPLLSVQWGPWAGAGMAEGLERRFQALGVGLLPPQQAFEALGLLLERGRPGCVAVLHNDWPRLAGQLGSRQAAVLQPLLDAGATGQEGGEGAALSRQLAAADDEQRSSLVVELLQQRLATVMGLEDPSSLDPGDSLFHIGLDSLMAVELAAGIQRDLGVKLELESLAGDPTIEALAAVLLETLVDPAGSADRVLDLGQEAQLPASWSLPATPSATPAPTSSAASTPPGEAILLTGASGFLGAYLLAGQLQRWDGLQVRCLVRAADAASGVARVRANLEHYGLWQQSWGERLVAVPGDLAQPRFGLSYQVFAELAAGIGGILHNGAQLSQMAPYSQLETANVGGTQTVLDLAVHPAAAGPLPVQLISSVAAFEAAAYRNRAVLESDDVAEWRGIHVGYSQTKWVSERRVLAAGAAGLPVTVYRPPLIGGHSQTGAWHQDDLLHRLLRGCLALGMAPDLPWELDLVPVDYVADAVTALAWTPEAVGRNVHLQHPQPMLLADLLGNLIERGAPLELVSMERWLEAIDADPANPLHGIRAFFVRRWGDEQLTYPELNKAGVRARPSCLATVASLAAHGVRCPGFEELIGPYARSLITGVASL